MRSTPSDRFSAAPYGSADVSNGLALVQELLSDPQLANDLYSFGEACGYGAVATGLWRLTFMELLLANSGR